MISVIEFLGYDVCNHLEKYVKKRVKEIKSWKKNNKIVLNELNDNILFTKHINYYKFNLDHNTEWRSDYHLRSMRENKINILNDIKKNGNRRGWIYSPEFSGFSWIISEVKSRELKKILPNKGILRFPDRSEWTLYRYPPPHTIHYDHKDLIENIKSQ